MTVGQVQFPDKLQGLFQPKRYKVLYGGRGGAKSWGVARALLLLAADRPLRVLCAREVQKSMRDSVHRLLKDQVSALGLESFYEVLDTEIRGLNGSLFLFSGLQQHTVDSIKSFEGVNIVWVEEAHGVSAKSWDVLIPTIRAEGSEIWLTLNPDMDTDDTYVRFIASPSDDTWLCEMNWRDNPWFPSVLEDERVKAKRSLLADDYDHIWEGKPRRVAEGAIYRYEIEALMTDGRVRDVPYDPTLPVHTVWDLGWNDAMTIIMVQRGPMDIRLPTSRTAIAHSIGMWENWVSARTAGEQTSCRTTDARAISRPARAQRKSCARWAEQCACWLRQASKKALSLPAWRSPSAISINERPSA